MNQRLSVLDSGVASAEPLFFLTDDVQLPVGEQPSTAEARQKNGVQIKIFCAIPVSTSMSDAQK